MLLQASLATLTAIGSRNTIWLRSSTAEACQTQRRSGGKALRRYIEPSKWWQRSASSVTTNQRTVGTKSDFVLIVCFEGHEDTGFGGYMARSRSLWTEWQRELTRRQRLQQQANRTAQLAAARAMRDEQQAKRVAARQ